MNKLPFKIARRTFMGVHDAAYVVDADADLQEELLDAVVESIGTDLHITVGETTMFLAAWRDPDHWSEDWSKLLGCDIAGVAERVAGILTSALLADS